ncbi:MAG: YwmB family TATA-box binding protein [Bacillota bacterium]
MNVDGETTQAGSGRQDGLHSEQTAAMGRNQHRAVSGVVALVAAGLAILGLGYALIHRLPDPLLQAAPGLEAVGAQLDQVTVTVWTPLPTAGQADTATARLVRDLGMVADPTSPAALAPGTDSERRAYRLPGGAGTVTLTLRRAFPATLSAVMEMPAPAHRWWEVRDRLVRAMGDPYGDAPRAYTVLQFSQSGSLLWSSRRQVAAAVLHNLGARVVEGADDEGLYSLTAFTPRLNQRLLVAGRPVNAAVALHWDASRGRSLLWLGSPLINIEY